MTTKQERRKKRALKRFEAQLKSGVKIITMMFISKFKRGHIENILEKNGYPRNSTYTFLGNGKYNIEVPLTDQNKNRIKKEINILNGKLGNLQFTS